MMRVSKPRKIGRGFLWAGMCAVLLLFSPLRAAAEICPGDCNGDHSVTVDEILTMVNIALGNTQVSDCSAGDTNSDGQITIDEILGAVNNALNGCPATPTETPTLTPTPTSTPTPIPPLRFDIQINPDPVRPGELMQVSITLTNPRAAALSAVEIHVGIPAQVSAFYTNVTTGAPATCSGTNACSPGEQLVWKVGTLAAGAGVTVSMPPAVAGGAAAPADGTVITFDAQALVAGSQATTAERTVIVNSQRLLDLVVAGNADPVTPGQRLAYQLSFGNSSTTTQAQSAMLSLPLPAGVDFVSADGGTLNAATGAVEWTLGTLSPGQTGSRELIVHVAPALLSGTLLRATAELTDSSGDTTNATAETRVQAGVPLQLTMALNPDPVQPNELVTGQLTVTNTGTVPLLKVAVEVFLPDEVVSFYTNETSGTDPASASCSGSNGCAPRELLLWAVGTLAPGAGVTLSAPLGMAKTVGPGDIVTFNALAAEASGFQAVTRGSVRVESSRLLDLAVAADAAPVTAGDSLTYHLSFGNPTTTTLASGVVLSLPVPVGATFVSTSDTDAQVADGVVAWAVGTLSPGETGSRDVVVQVNAGVQNGVVLEAAAQIADNGGRRTRATAETRVQAGVPLQLTMALNPDPVQPNELVTGQLTVTNTGTVPLLKVAVELFLPDQIVPFYTSQTSGASASCSGSNACSQRELLLWAVGTLAPGAGVTLSAPLGMAKTVSPGGIVTFNALAAEASGFQAEARGSVRVQTP